MPYKRKRRFNAQTGKQKKLITSRLMEISLKVDDYIYKNKIIAANDAEKYVQEVASYKPLCGSDERCLQVIEKLTRIMKAIIAEQQEVTADICNENYTFENMDQIEGSISPVYSTPDEDRTQYAPVISEDDINNAMTERDKDIVDLCDSDDEILQEGITHGISIMIVDVEIHREMSNPSLTPINEDATQMTSADYECSQSILKHFENIDVNEQIQVKQNDTSSNGEYSQSILKNVEINTEQVTKHTENVACNEIRTVVDNDYVINVNKNVNPMVTPRYTQVATVTTDAAPKSSNNPILTIDPTSNNIQIDNTGINVTSNNFITPSYNQNTTKINTDPSIGETVNSCYHNTNKHCESYNKNAIAIANDITDNLSNTFSAINKNSSSRDDNCSNGNELNTVVISEDNKQIKKKNNANRNKKYKPEETRVNTASTVKTIHIEDDKTKPDGNSIPTIKKRSRKKKTEETPDNKDKHLFKKPPVKRTANNTVKQPKKIIQIYNKNTENDLSWMENIRFVREINENEYDSQLKFADDFWDSCIIPGILNEDFN